jgi:CRP-like cAMP-binding protein
MTNNIRIVLKQFADFNGHELDRILSCFRHRHVPRNSILLHEGSICREFYFVNRGCIRTYFTDRSGQMKTRYVMLENHIGTALTSFISQKPSFELLDAIEDTELLVISHFDFYRLNHEMENWKHFYQRMLEMAYSFQNKKIERLVTLTAKQRYELVLKENPALIQRLSNKLLASYLDIREETLSRLKSK